MQGWSLTFGFRSKKMPHIEDERPTNQLEKLQLSVLTLVDSTKEAKCHSGKSNKLKAEAGVEHHRRCVSIKKSSEKTLAKSVTSYRIGQTYSQEITDG